MDSNALLVIKKLERKEVSIKVKILNLFAGIGGNRSKWGEKHHITAVEFDEEIASIYQKRFPNDKIIITNAFEFFEKHYKDYDFIWASPPCQTHTNLMYPRKDKKLPDLRLYSMILLLEKMYYGNWIVECIEPSFLEEEKEKNPFWVIENVKPYYKPLIPYTVKLNRHLFWSNFTIQKKRFEVNWSHPRGQHYVSVKELCKVKNVDYELIKPIYKRDHLKGRQLLRNCVLEEIGKYILNILTNQKQMNLTNYITNK